MLSNLGASPSSGNRTDVCIHGKARVGALDRSVPDAFDPCAELSRCLFRQRPEPRPSFLCGSPDLRSGCSRQYSFLGPSRLSARRSSQGFRGSANSVQLMLQLTQLSSELPLFTFNRSENVHESSRTNLSQNGCGPLEVPKEGSNSDNPSACKLRHPDGSERLFPSGRFDRHE
jgi:hypothetical protein